MTDFDQESRSGPFHVKLIEGERAPEPRPLSHIEWPSGKPPGGIITPQQLQSAIDRAAAARKKQA